MSVDGIDIAGYQNNVYDTSGLGFVFVKATEGQGYVNPKHATQVATARSRGLVVGHYHFARPSSVTAQADYFLAHAKAQTGDVLAFDWEDTGVSGADKDAWLRYVQAKAPEHRVILYCNRDFWLHRDATSFCADGLWIADPSAPKGQPRVEHPWLFHQYSETGGIDHDVASFPSPGALRTWAFGTPAPQEEIVTKAEMETLATMVADKLVTAPYRDKQALTVLYWLAAGVDPTLPIPTDGTAAAWVGRFRTAMKNSGLSQISSQVDALGNELADPSGIVSQMKAALEGIKINLSTGA